MSMNLDFSFQSIVENSRDLIGVPVQDGSYVFISNYFQKTLGYSYEETIGKSYLEHIHPEDRLRVQQHVLRCFESGNCPD